MTKAERVLRHCALPVLLLLAAAPVRSQVPAPTAVAAVASPHSARDERLARLHGELDQLIGAGSAGADQWSVLVVSLDRGDTLYAHAPGRALAPASNMKLYTTAAALYYLGADFRFSTYLLTNGTIRNGVLDGDVILYGTGDPTLTGRLLGYNTPALDALADTLVALGVREVRGAVVGDGSYFAGPGAATGWQASYINAAYAAPAGALSVGENIVTLRVTPGAVGQRPDVVAVPGGRGLAIVNEATTVASGSTTITAARETYDGPIVIRGRIRRGSGSVLRTLPVGDPARYTAAVFREVLERRGVRVAGDVRSIERADESAITGRTVFAPAYDKEPTLHVLTVHRSEPLLLMLHVINRRSHNFYAEQVLRAVGRVAVDDGSVAGGARAIGHFLAHEAGADTSGLAVHDGSGLSVMNRSSAGTFVQLLKAMAASPLGEQLMQTLPEAGTNAGLRRMQGTLAAGNLRAKTGTIQSVSSLSGYVRAANGERLAFSIISNNVASTWRAKRIEDAVGARLALFTRPLHGAETSATPERTP